MTRGDVLFIYDKSFIGDIIKDVTKGKYSHTAIYLGNGLILETSPINLKVMKLKDAGYKKYDIKTPDCEYSLMMKSLKEILKDYKQVRYYDYIQAVSFFVINVLRKYKIKWFQGNTFVICSEVCAKYLTKCKVKIKKYKDAIESLLSPNDLQTVYRFK